MDNVDFGFKQVTKTEKVKQVNQVFSSVAKKYDVMNDLMSLGLHRHWKNYAISQCAVRPNHIVLDLACGSGDLLLKFAKIVNSDSQIYGTDINNAMLLEARDRLIDAGLCGVNLCQGDGHKLPYPDDSFDVVSMAFGLRNVVDKSQVLSEIYRVLRPGGRVVVLEFSHPTQDFMKKPYDWYSFSCLPFLGKLVAGDSASYQYLAESIRMHPDQEKLKSMFEAVQFSDCEYVNLLGGIVAVHKGFKF